MGVPSVVSSVIEAVKSRNGISFSIGAILCGLGYIIMRTRADGSENIGGTLISIGILFLLFSVLYDRIKYRKQYKSTARSRKKLNAILRKHKKP